MVTVSFHPFVFSNGERKWKREVHNTADIHCLLSPALALCSSCEIKTPSPHFKSKVNQKGTLSESYLGYCGPDVSNTATR